MIKNTVTSHIAILLTGASLLAWSASTEAQMRTHTRSEDRPTIEVHLKALQQLHSAPVMLQPSAPAAMPTAAPFESKPIESYADAPAQNIQNIQPPVAVPTPPPATMAATQAPQPMPWKSTPIASSQPLATPPAPIAPAPAKAKAPSLPPPALPYGAARYQAPAAPQTGHSVDDSSWWDDTSDFVGDLFNFSDDEPQQAMRKAPAAQPTAPAAPADVTAMAPPVRKPINTHIPDPTAPNPSTQTAITAPSGRSIPVGNAATYDGFELAEALAGQQGFAAPATPYASRPAPDPIPLPKPTSPETEVLLAEITEPSPMQAPKAKKQSIKPIASEGVKTDADPNPQTVAAPLSTPQEIGRIIPPPPMAIEKPEPAITPIAKAAPEPAPTAEVDKAEEQTNLNRSATLAEEKPIAPPLPAIASTDTSNEEQPWFDGLKKDLDGFFDGEKKAQEESKIKADHPGELKAPADPAMAKEEPFLPPPPAPTPTAADEPAKPESDAPQPKAVAEEKAATKVEKPVAKAPKSPEKKIEKVSAEKTSTEQTPSTQRKEKEIAQETPKAPTKKTAITEPTKAPLPPLPPVAKAAPAPSLPSMSKIVGDEATIKEAEQQKVETTKPLPPLPSDDTPTVAKNNAPTKAQIPPPPPPPPVIEKPKPVEEKKPVEVKKPTIEEAKKPELPAVKEISAIPPPPPPPPMQKAAPKQAASANKEEQAIAALTPEVVVSPSDSNAKKDLVEDLQKELQEDTQKQVVLTRDDAQEQMQAASESLTENLTENPMEMAALPKASAPVPTVTSSKLIFSQSETDLTSALKKQLKSTAASLKTSDNKRLTVYAYASAAEGQEVLARRIALARGLAVRAYLIEQGVNALRISVESKGNPDGEKTPNEVLLELKELSGS